MKTTKDIMFKYVIPSVFIASTFTMAGCLEKPKGTLNISTDPMALEIFVDGEKKGVSPSVSGQFLGVEVIEGERKITATKQIDDFEEYFVTKEVFVAKDTTQVVTLSPGTETRTSAQGKENLKTFTVNCDAGEANKCISLASYYTRLQTTESLALANGFLSAACEANDVSACYNYAENLSEGIGGKAETTLANEFYQRACEKGNFLSCRALAANYSDGKGSQKNNQKAIEILSKACEANNMQSCTQLGVLYLKEDDLDSSLAFDPLSKSCENDEGAACYSIGLVLKETNLNKSKAFFEKGCELNFGSACEEEKAIRLAEKKKLEEENKKKEADAAIAKMRALREQYKKPSQNETYYGVKWSGQQIDSLSDHGFQAKQISEHIYEKNTQCSKRVKSVSKKDQFVCIKYKCGFSTWSYVIDTYRDAGQVKSTGSCWF